MRAEEFLREFWKRKPKDYGKAHRDGLDLEYFIGSGPGAGTLTINAKSSGGTTLGQVTFKEYGNRRLEALDLWVDEEVRGQGIAAIMYDWVKELGYTIERSNAQTDAGRHFWSKNRGTERVWESELDEIARIPDDYYAGGKESLPIKPSATKSQIKPLPGGSGFGYYTRETPASIIIYIVDPNKPAEQRDNKNDIIVAMLSLEKCQWIPGSYVVGSVTTDEAYRGRGLGHSLYGIALSILGLTLVSGTEQTSGGRSIWKIISNFPGVDIKGYTKATDNQTKQLLKQNGAQPLVGDYWTFPIKQGKHELKSTIPDVPTYHTQFAKDVPHHKIYRTGLIAKWNSGQPDTVNEIARIPQTELGDWGEAGTLEPPKDPVKKKELPGGSGYTYAVNKTGKGDLEIMIFDGEKLAAELDLFETQDVLNTWGVETVVVERPYRGQGLGKALYGIALSILRLTIEAGQTQTRHGQQMWLMLNSIPGVEVMGYNMVPTEKYRPHPGDRIVKQDNTWTRYTFPVESGSRSMRSARPGTGLYNSQATMIARWTGR
jgi:GNAT superfamily N-acetyltransferase